MEGSDLLPESSFTLEEDCSVSLDDPGLYDLEQGPPCSLNSSVHPLSVTDPSTTYRLLANGLTNMTSNYNNIDFSTLDVSYDLGKIVTRQVVAHQDKDTGELHAFFMDLPSLREECFNQSEPSRSKIGFKPETNEITTCGQDFFATTTSVVTKCISATKSCNLTVDKNSGNSLQYNCSQMFSGQLNTIPRNGIDRMVGWNTSFYHVDEGTPRAISVASRLNPFTYNVTGLINSLDMTSLKDSPSDPQGTDGSLMEAGNDHIGFALSCISTVYNIEYSMVGGNISYFSATLASGIEAAVIKAPLQVGLGTYTLYLQAALGVLLTGITVPDAMGLAFSQVGLAYASGAYKAVPAGWMRYRVEIELTMIPKASYLFLIALCFLYAFLVLGFAIAAFVVRRRGRVAQTQALLAKDNLLENCET